MAEYTQLQSMRDALRQAIGSQSLRPGEDLDDLAERMTIVATELATNALRHGLSPAVVELRRSTTAFLVDVADSLPSIPPRIIDDRPIGVGGRGLRITQDLAQGVGWYAADNSKHVWARFVIPRRIRRFQAPRISIFDQNTVLRLLRRRIR